MGISTSSDFFGHRSSLIRRGSPVLLTTVDCVRRDYFSVNFDIGPFKGSG